MAVTVKKVTLWQTEVKNKPGALSSVLGPLAEAGADLQVVMGYHYHGGEHKAAIEVCPVSGKKSTAAASKAGLAASAIPTLLVQGDIRPSTATRRRQRDTHPTYRQGWTDPGNPPMEFLPSRHKKWHRGLRATTLTRRQIARWFHARKTSLSNAS